MPFTILTQNEIEAARSHKYKKSGLDFAYDFFTDGTGITLLEPLVTPFYEMVINPLWKNLNWSGG